MNDKMKVKRGEIYYYDFGQNEGSIQNGLRPVLIVQCDEGNANSTTTIVAPITTAIKKRYLPSHIYLNESCGLKKPSMVLLEQLKTISQSDLQERVGCLNDLNSQKAVNAGLKKALGLWVDKPRSDEDIRCLCSSCLSNLKLNKDIVIRRRNPFDKIKHKCDKCTGTGYEYVLIEKQRSRGGSSGR